MLHGLADSILDEHYSTTQSMVYGGHRGEMTHRQFYAPNNVVMARPHILETMYARMSVICFEGCRLLGTPISGKLFRQRSGISWKIERII